MSIPVPIWATFDSIHYYDQVIRPQFPTPFYSVSSYFFLVAGVVFFPLALFLSRHSIQQIVEITFGSRSSDVVGHLVGRRVYYFTALYFVFSSLFWGLTVVHGLIGVFIASSEVNAYSYNNNNNNNNSLSYGPYNYCSIYFLQGTYGHNPLFLWVLFGLWAASLELVTYSTYLLVGQKMVHLDQKNDTIPYRLLALFIPLRFIYLFILRGIGGQYTVYYVYGINYILLFVEVALFWQSGWQLVKKMTNAYGLRPDTDGHKMRYFCKLALVFTAFWLLSVIKYLLYCFTASSAFPGNYNLISPAQVFLNLTYIWFSIIQAATSMLITMVYTFKQ